MQKQILLIDDDKDEFYILHQAIQLAELSHICMWAGDMAHAELLLEQVLPDMILIDYNMPVTNGIQCLGKIRQMNKLHQVPVVIYSNYINDVTRQQATAQGASCMEKPASMLQLVQFMIRLNGEGKVLHSLC
jgi:CheY-like chemotaxis protein